jgi:hypothetical protein
MVYLLIVGDCDEEKSKEPHRIDNHGNNEQKHDTQPRISGFRKEEAAGLYEK